MSTPRPLPQWLVERIALGEVPEPMLQSIRARLEESPVSEEQLRALVEENEAFLRAHPPEPFVRRVQQRHDSRLSPNARTDRKPIWGLALAGVVAALVVVLLPQGDTDDERAKGLNPGISVFRKGSGGAELLSSGAHVHAGDVLQLRYHAAGRRYGVILSVDGAGNVTVHWPGVAGGTAAVQSKGEAVLPNAYRLDSAPRFERFFFVTSDQPLAVDSVVGSARAWAAAGFPETGLALPSGTDLSSVVLVKDNP